eukprot:3708854-Lingulodinium_polyedra.AAC.1
MAMAPGTCWWASRVRSCRPSWTSGPSMWPNGPRSMVCSSRPPALRTPSTCLLYTSDAADDM